jgi:N utilization substance protein B
MTRRELREHVFRILFAYDFYTKNPEEAKEQIQLYFTHEGGDEMDYPPEELTEEEAEEVTRRVCQIAEKIPQIDERSNRAATGWNTQRMSRADLAILRLAVYEMLWDDNIPTGVAINEAVLLARKFGGDDSSSFVNGILAKMERLREKA